MIIRSIVSKEIDSFVGLGLGDADQKELKDLLINWWKEGRNKPEWCFIAEEDGKFIARVFYAVFPDNPQDLMAFGLYVDNVEAAKETGVRLITESLDKMQNYKFNIAEYHIYFNPDKHFNEYRNIMLSSGFKITQEKKSFYWTGEPLPKESGRLEYRSLNDVGKDAFIEAIKIVTRQTLDGDDTLIVEEIGEELAAEKEFNLLKGIDYNEEWWKLAYVNGELAGLIIPQKFSDKDGAINYIGVVPQKRGQGFVEDLLINGTATLKEYGIEEVMGDIDKNNFPMEQALIRTGYKFRKPELVMKRDLKNSKIILEPINKSHLEFIYNTANNDILMNIFHDKSTSISEWDNIIDIWNKDEDEEDYVITRKSDGIHIGWIGINGLLSENKTVWIKMIVLLPRFWGNGYGSKVINEVKQILKSRGYREIQLWTDESNERAQKCYKLNGFSVMDKKQGSVGNRDILVNRLLMNCKL